MNISDFYKLKQLHKPITMVTCYDYWTARILAATNIDCVLVGDSVAQIMHGHNSTLPADIAMLENHIYAVKRGIGDKFVIGDLPFMSYRKSPSESMSSVEKIMKAGANAVKLEGVIGNEILISHIVASGVPVMGHLGFTPQSINMFGNSIVQGKGKTQAAELLEAARKLEGAGCFAIVLECIPFSLAAEITDNLSIPTIGIGAGARTSGQVLVLQDLIGANPDFNPKFLKKYIDVFGSIKDAVNEYCQEVETSIFPAQEHCYKEEQNANNQITQCVEMH